MVLGDGTDGYEPHEQWTSLRTGIRPVHDWPDLDFTGLHRSPAEDEAFCFQTYMYLSNLWSSISSARMYRENLDCWKALNMYHVEKGALLFVLDRCWTLLQRRSGLHGRVIPLSIDRYGWDRYASQLWPLVTAMWDKDSYNTVNVEEHHELYGTEVQEVMDVTGRKISVLKNKKKCTACLVEITTAIKRHMPVVDGLS